MTFTWEDVPNDHDASREIFECKMGGVNRRGITIHDRNVQESL